MRKHAFLPFFSVGIALFLFFNLPPNITKIFRDQVGQIFVTFSKISSFAKHSFQTVKKIEYDHIETENYLLKDQLRHVKELLFAAEEAQKIVDQEETSFKDVFTQLITENAMVHAKVIYRDPHVWGSTLWINQGSKANERLKMKVIEKNSPVVIGNKLVGVVEEVFPQKAKIRLITDDSLRLSVCSYRGKSKDREIEACLTSLEQLLGGDDILYDVIQEYRRCKKESQETGPIARGEIFGTSLPLWKIQQNYLKGRGFHSFQNPYKHDTNLFKVGDLLFTAGLDDLFPEGLFVGTIQSISPLTEGAFHYQIEAMPAIPNLRDVTFVTVIPSLSTLQEMFFTDE